MADAPPPYSAQPAYNPAYSSANAAYPPQNVGYPLQSPPYPPAQPGYPQAQPGYSPGPNADKGYSYAPPANVQGQPRYCPPAQPAMPVAAVQPQQQQQQVIVISGGAAPVPPGVCPLCRIGHASDSFSCCGICLAIFFFPLGLICCLLMRETRCSNCGAHM